ncbi:hypothetical protein M422DRAFT_276918 [Sphaerobolus stellatus SS14]|uniref:Uncharacterized protein n=1 Tax=Sphaerobolus stellatus (strain SS14) TaxID=990650 RepID=A0A0C9T1G8_SPHS4|nr:hypothetical protein M422DRAFT_276918 [Sphaerobolus stellatus SS14]
MTKLRALASVLPNVYARHPIRVTGIPDLRIEIVPSLIFISISNVTFECNYRHSPSEQLLPYIGVHSDLKVDLPIRGSVHPPLSGSVQIRRLSGCQGIKRNKGIRGSRWSGYLRASFRALQA